MKILKKAYEEFWVPVFGRLVMLFAGFIEGEEPENKENQTYNLKTNDHK